MEIEKLGTPLFITFRVEVLKRDNVFDIETLMFLEILNYNRPKGRIGEEIYFLVGDNERLELMFGGKRNIRKIIMKLYDAGYVNYNICSDTIAIKRKGIHAINSSHPDFDNEVFKSI